MEKWAMVFLIFLNSFAVNSTTCDTASESNSRQDNYLKLFLSTDPEVSKEQYNLAFDSWHKFINKMKEHPGANYSSSKFVEHLYKNLYRSFLRDYNREADFGDLFTDTPSYNCLTSVALVSLTLETFGIPHVIRETNNHVYIILSEHELLIETTAKRGIVKGEKNIERAERKYAQGNRSGESNPVLPLYIDKSLSLDQLVGLLYFNLVVDHIRTQDWVGAMPLLLSAEEYYYSMRISYFKMRVNARLPENMVIHMRYRR